ncbi:MAG: polysaccharide export protein [Deltaproteobacteria bacterium]|nr:polysaccharide export protein [Deltaproteobacteria bacterium]
MKVTSYIASMVITLLCVVLVAYPALALDNLNRRSLFDRPAPSETQGKPASAKPVAETDAQTQQKQITSKEVPIPKLRPKQELAPEIADEFKQATQMEVKEYLRRYGVPDTKKDYKVSPMDVIGVTVFDEPDLSRENLRVSSQGRISLPLLGELKVEGLSPRKIEQLIQIRYRQEQILKHPQVSVQVNEFKGQRVLVLGAVNNPGGHTKEGNERLAEMLAKAGGIKFDADGDVAANKIRILRTVEVPGKPKQRISMEIDLDSLTRGDHPEYNMPMLNGDVIYVPEAARFFVTGEVKTPGYYKIKDRSISVVEAITMAGGLTRIAAGNRTKLVRYQDGKEVTIEVPVDDILDGDKSKDITVRPNDVIVVPQSYF